MIKETDYNVSVVIATYNEEKYILNALSSLYKQDIGYSNLEIIIIDGGSNDNTIELILTEQQKHDNIFLFDNPQKISPVAFNIGIKNSTAPYILLMSAHSEYPSNYISLLYQEILDVKCDLIGGYAKTVALNKNKKTQSIISVFQNKLGLGGAKVRTGVDRLTEVDTATGLFDRNIFNKVGLFNEKLIRHQDMELSKRIKNSGGKIFITPKVTFNYFVRESFSELWKNNFRNGKWVPITVAITKQKDSLSLRHFIPLMFVSTLIVLTILSTISIYFLGLNILLILLYFSVIFFTSLKMWNKETSLFNLIGTFLTLHFSYGLGSLIGLMRVDKIFH